MLLQQILTHFDAELSRLHKLRAVVASLHRPASPALAPAPVPKPAPVAVLTTPEPSSDLKEVTHRSVRTRRISSRPPRTPRRSKPERPAEITALTSAIPAGPVIVSAKDLARERERRAKVRVVAAATSPAHEEINVDALTRDISARWARTRNRPNA